MILRALFLALLWLCWFPAGSVADYLVLSRTAHVRLQPDSDSESLHHLSEGAILILLENDQTSGYYNVQPQLGGRAGWVYRTMGRRHLGDPESAGPATPTPVPPDPGGGIGGEEDASAFAIPNCPPEGNSSPNYSRFEELKELNRRKNRMRGPAPSQVEEKTLQSFLAQGQDESRWSHTQAVRVVGWVAEVKAGGKETCNCKSTDSQYYDTHIELKRGPNDHGLPMIVEVKPQWRALRATQGQDWTTAGLRNRFLHQNVAVTGWLTFDSQHSQNANNTNQGRG